MDSSAQTESPESLGHMMAKGAAWMTTFKIVDRCTAVVSTSILARLLVALLGHPINRHWASRVYYSHIGNRSICLCYLRVLALPLAGKS